jgi:hypothetical protein
MEWLCYCHVPPRAAASDQLRVFFVAARLRRSRFLAAVEEIGCVAGAFILDYLHSEPLLSDSGLSQFGSHGLPLRRPARTVRVTRRASLRSELSSFTYEVEFPFDDGSNFVIRALTV